jgi:hypothetical protein
VDRTVLTIVWPAYGLYLCSTERGWTRSVPVTICAVYGRVWGGHELVWLEAGSATDWTGPGKFRPYLSVGLSGLTEGWAERVLW